MNPYISAYEKNAADRKSASRRTFFSASALVVFFLLGVSFLMVYKHTVGQSLLLEVSELRTVQKYLLTEQSVLLGEKQSALSRTRIISYARERLQLDFPSPERIRWIKVESAFEVE